MTRLRNCLAATLIGFLALALPTTGAPPAAASSLPPGFFESTIGGLSAPTAMAFAPDGRLFVAQQTGQLRIIQNGALLPNPFASLSVSSNEERGLLGVAFPPDFATSKRVYVYFTMPTPSPHNVVAWIGGADTNTATTGPNVIMTLPDLGAPIHNGGAIHFHPIDSQLYVAVGENALPSEAQNLSSPLGKILRVDANGAASSGNPSFGGAPHDARVWAYGLRNPFTFNFQPGTGAMFINDVGSNGAGACGSGTWEEINPGSPGANYGWPLDEGPPVSGACTHAGVTYPVHAVNHIDGACAFAGGTFYNPDSPQLEQSFVGAYFFADLCAGWIRFRLPNASIGQLASGISGPVDVQTGPDGALWYAARNGTVGRIAQVPTTFFIRNSPNTGVANSSFVFGILGDRALFCDWDGNGTDTIGVYRNGAFFLRNSNTTGVADITLGFGDPGDRPVCGDWNGDGTDTIGVFRNGAFFLRNSNTTGVANTSFGYGDPGDVPLAGDWDGNGTDTIGVHRSGVFFLRNANTTGVANLTVAYGNPSDIAVPGDWDGNGTDTVAIWRPGGFFLRNSNTTGTADSVASYGNGTDRPVKGNFDGSAGDGIAVAR